MKAVKIIGTVFSPRTLREETELEGDPLIYSMGSQNFQSVEDIKNLIKLIISEEEKTDPGMDLDLAIVNNDIGNKDANSFLDKFHGRKLKRGKVLIIHKPDNKGWTYGAYNFGFNKLKDLYDFFIFTEDDTLINKNNYAIDAVNKFKSIKECGFVAFIGINYKQYFKLNLDDCIHAHSGAGLSSKSVLETIQKINGNLPYYDGPDTNDYIKVIKAGEIKFTNLIHKNNFKLVNISENIKYFDFAYDLMRGLKVPLKG